MVTGLFIWAKTKPGLSNGGLFLDTAYELAPHQTGDVVIDEVSRLHARGVFRERGETGFCGKVGS